MVRLTKSKKGISFIEAHFTDKEKRNLMEDKYMSSCKPSNKLHTKHNYVIKCPYRLNI